LKRRFGFIVVIMKNITIQTLRPVHSAAVLELQSAYAAVYPEAAVIPGEVIRESHFYVLEL
jgi:hypothetical protein